MELTGIQNSLSFTKASQNNACPGGICKPKINTQKQNCTYGQLAVENAILKKALRDASRIIAHDMYVKTTK